MLPVKKSFELFETTRFTRTFNGTRNCIIKKRGEIVGKSTLFNKLKLQYCTEDSRLPAVFKYYYCMMGTVQYSYASYVPGRTVD